MTKENIKENIREAILNAILAGDGVHTVIGTFYYFEEENEDTG